jgi:hypothetical protein
MARGDESRVPQRYQGRRRRPSHESRTARRGCRYEWNTDIAYEVKRFDHGCKSGVGCLALLIRSAACLHRGIASLAATLPGVAEQLAIQALFARYCWGLNTGDADGVIACFGTEGWLEHTPPKRYVGAEIRSFLEGLWYGRAHRYLGRQHHPHNFLLERDAETVRARVQWSVTRLEPAENTFHVFLLGHWEARCVQHEDHWRFHSLQVVHWFRQSAPWVGRPEARLVLAGDEKKGPAEI